MAARIRPRILVGLRFADLRGAAFRLAVFFDGALRDFGFELPMLSPPIKRANQPSDLLFDLRAGFRAGALLPPVE